MKPKLEAGRQVGPRRRAHRLVQLERSVDATPDIVFGRLRKAEDTQPSVTIHLRDKTRVTPDHSRCDLVQLRTDRIYFFGVERLAETRVVAQVGEHEGDVGPLPKILRVALSLVVARALHRLMASA